MEFHRGGTLPYMTDDEVIVASHYLDQRGTIGLGLTRAQSQLFLSDIVSRKAAATAAAQGVDATPERRGRSQDFMDNFMRRTRPPPNV